MDFPINLGLIAAVLRDKYPIKIIDNYATKLSYAEFLRAIYSESPKYLLVTGYLGGYYYKFIKRFFRDIKQVSPRTTIIIGGPMATAILELILKNTDADIVVIGEGEETIADLINSLERYSELNRVQGIAFKSKINKIAVTKMRERIKNLDILPRPAYELFPIKNYLNSGIWL